MPHRSYAPALISTETAARVLGVSPEEVRKLARAGELPARAQLIAEELLLFAPEDVTRLVARRRRRGAEEATRRREAA